jgi:hypothetical protein
VTRYYAGSSAFSRVDRILTLNSAHHGAPLARNLLNGNAKVFMVTLANAVAAPPSLQFLPRWGTHSLLGVVNGFTVTVAVRMAPLNAPVLHDMEPRSIFFRSLHAAEATERSRTRSRVGIGTAAKPDGILCRGLKPESWRGCNKAITMGKYL